MKRKIILSVTVVFMFLLVPFWGMAEEVGNNPVAVSPGSETEAVIVWQSCPTFSWTSVDRAASYRIAVFEAIDPIVTPYEDIAAKASPVISKDIPGPALSWTLSSEESLKSGSMYVWYVQAVDATGNALGLWSGGRIFKVEQEIRFAGVEEKLAEKLREYGINEETITNVLKDIKSEVKEVVVRNGGAGNKNNPGASVVQGYEGDPNTFYGLQAGYSSTTGVNNTFIGCGAGYSNTSANSNTFLGYSAGYGNTTGALNTFIGRSAGYQNTTGNQNTFIGHFSGFSNSTGINNTFLGANAGNLNTSGHFNTFLGHSAGLNNTTGCYNTFLGQIAGYSNTTGYSNTFIGNEAGNGNTEGYENTFIGRGAGAANTTGNSNTFIGRSAGVSNTTGTANTLLGYTAGSSNTTGSLNTFIGYEAGKATTTGNNNTFIGYDTGMVNTYGSQNIFIGNYAGRNQTTGFNNIFLGHWTGLYNTTGVCNLFLGNSAGYNNITGHSNIFLGIEAGYNNTTASENTFIGNGTGRSNTTGIKNVFLGSGAGYLNSAGDSNVFLGFNAGFNETGSNKLYIANSDTSSPLIYGEFDNGIVTVNGKLGVGTKSPLGTFEIEKTGANAVFIFERTDGAQGKFTARPGEIYIGSGSNHNVQVVANNNVVMTLTPGGYVGIGTPTPSYPLHMSSGAYCSVGGTWTNASSRELKENIIGLSSDEALDALNKLSPVKYNYKIDKTDKHVGFIAEDAPELVATADRKGMSPMDVVAVLTKVVQEQQKVNLEQEMIISDLQERIAKIEKNNE